MHMRPRFTFLFCKFWMKQEFVMGFVACGDQLGYRIPGFASGV